MTRPNRSITILMADDDEDDCRLAQDALESSRVLNEIRFVHDGEELLQYLRRQGAYTDPASAPAPGLVLLDLNMPRMDGREALAEIKSDKDLRRFPVVVLTTSRAEEDIFWSYDLGVNSFVVKPISFDDLVVIFKSLTEYWFQIVEAPCDGKHN
jgi:CheY-like chemotaxis protein